MTFAHEYVSMHVMEHSNAAFARSEEGSLSGSGVRNPTGRMAFTGCNMRTAEVTDIAASKGMKFTAGAGFTSAVN